jgi:hypothetical protein
MKMSENDPQIAAVDPPIIIQGGGSVEVDLPSKFKEKSSSAAGKKFKSDTSNLVSIQIDEDTPIVLNKNSKITINFE